MLMFLFFILIGKRGCLGENLHSVVQPGQALQSPGPSTVKVVISAIPLESYEDFQFTAEELLKHNWNSPYRRNARDGFVPPSSIKAISCSVEEGSTVQRSSELLMDFIPVTSFKCLRGQQGYFADIDASCRVFHYCHEDSERPSMAFLCPPCTLFSEEKQLCDFWYHVNCPTSPSLALGK